MSCGIQELETKTSARRYFAVSKEASVVFIGQAAAGAGAIVGIRILTSLLPPSEFGAFALSFTLVMIIQYCYAGTSAAAMRFFVPALEQKQFCQYLIAAWRLQHRRGLLTTLLAVVSLPLLIYSGHGAFLPLGLATLVVAVLDSYGGFMDGIQNAARQRAVVALHQGAKSWLRLAGAILFVGIGGANANSVVWGFAVGTAVTYASQCLFYYRMKHELRGTQSTHSQIPTGGKWFSSMVNYSWPYLIWSIPAWIEFSSGRWSLELFCGSAEVGVFAAIYQLSFVPINIVTQLITQLVTPIIFAYAGDLSDAKRIAKSRSLNTKLVGAACLWTIIAVGAVMLFQTPIGELFLDSRYHRALHLLPLVVFMSGLFATTQLAELFLITANQTATLMWPKIVVSVVACPAFLAGAYFGGITGVVWSGVLTMAIRLIWVLAISFPRATLAYR